MIPCLSGMDIEEDAHQGKPIKPGAHQPAYLRYTSARPVMRSNTRRGDFSGSRIAPTGRR